jgi:hypothetical protein
VRARGDNRYARTSIQAAKRNAQKHRDADGGQISWRNETLRRHGVLQPPEEQGVKQLFAAAAAAPPVRCVGPDGRAPGRTVEDEIVKAHVAKGKGKDG